MFKVNSIEYNPNLLNFALLIFRVFVGAAMMSHGFPKLMMLFSGDKIEFVSFLGLNDSVSLGLAVFAEFVCSFFLILGLFTRLALIPLIIAMLYAFFGVHFHDEFGKMELALFYLVSYILLLVTGPGKFSVDGMTYKKRNAW